MRIFGLDIRPIDEMHPADEDFKLRSVVKRLEIDLRQTMDELSQLQGHHLKLRKQFDGSKGGRPIGGGGDKADLEAIAPGDKARLRAYAGIKPGQPATR